MVIEGEGLAGVTVTLAGGPADENFTMMTDADGMYRFEDLRPGDYTVSISDFDTRDYEFAATSQDVSVDLDETGTVSFTGVLLRTSGISGRVSVEGMGLDDIAVTLSGGGMDEARTATTDAGGQYSFTGLAAGDYTVTIAVASAAYVFESMSQDRTVGDDDSQIVNFEGQHARTASVSGHLFLDELDKNNEYDAGEHPLAHAGIPVALVGPGVNEQRIGASDATGAFSFTGLRAGAYQLVFLNDAATAAALAASHVAYGGPGTGYEVTLGVGEARTQAIPFDITHTTVNFSVSLRSGAAKGDALSGASVTLYGANDARVGTGMTGDDGSVAIVVARAGTSGNMVMAGVSADGYHVADGKTEVSWDPQMFATAGANANDIVNLNVNATVSGATVAHGDYGGAALDGWAIGVTSGGAAVAGAPTALDSDGTASFATTVEAGDLPASFTFAVAANQDDALDGGETYNASGGGYTHTGLSVAAGEADPIVVTYTTQTLRVYVHQEKDQVRGYTGNILGGDQRMSGLVDFEIRQAKADDGRFTDPISSRDWDARANSSDSRGVYTFAHLPADKDIVVRATARAGYKILDHVQLDAYRNKDENGLTGGMFGAMGGWGHTVSLCPLEEVEPTGQDFGKCASFGLVKLHKVTADVSKMRVRRSGSVFHSSDPSVTTQSGVVVSLTPVEGKNLGGIGGTFTTAKSNDSSTPEDDRRAHNFGAMAAGSYTLGLSDGWMAMAGTATGQSVLDPLGGDVALTVTPKTATLYGFVRNTNGFPLVGVKVVANGAEDTTDEYGRYIVTGIADDASVAGRLSVHTERPGFANSPTVRSTSTNSPVPAFAANTVGSYNITLDGANNTVTITGTVTESGTGDGIPGVEIKVDDEAPLNKATGGTLVTGADGSYTAIIEAQPTNSPIVNVSASKSGWHFLPREFPVPAIQGTSGATANFEGRRAAAITGMVTAPGGGMPMANVVVTAYSDSDRSTAIAGANVTTNDTGTFSIPVSPLSGTVYLGAAPVDSADVALTDPNYNAKRDAARYVWFDDPDGRTNGAIAVIPGQNLNFGTFAGRSVQPRITSAVRKRETGVSRTPDGSSYPLTRGEFGDSIIVTWQYDSRNENSATGGAVDAYSADSAFAATGETRTGTSAYAAPSGGVANTNGNPRGTAAAGTSVTHTRTTRYRLNPSSGADREDFGDVDVRISTEVRNGAGTVVTGVLASTEVAGVPTGVTGLTPTIGSGTTRPLTATWMGPGSPALEHRVALRVTRNNTSVWVAFGGSAPAQPAITRTTAAGANYGRWSTAPFNLNAAANGGVAWTVIDGAGTTTVTFTQTQFSAGVDMIRVDTKVDGGNAWEKHTPVAIP